jgi:hypothetical protein
MSETPRTDVWEFVAFVTDSTMRRHDCKVIHADRARELESDLAAAVADLAESDSIRDRLAHILADTAVALKGPNLPLTLHSWHDLAEVATTIKLASDIGEELLAQERKAHAAAVERAERAEDDARRYRWLRAEHRPPGLPLAQVVWKQNMDRNSSEWVNTIDPETLDRDIDAAIAKEPKS